jgi:dCMP deaminase
MIHKIKSNSWDEHFIKMAELIASKSKDPSTKVGCVVVGPDNEVLSTGFNGFPRGVDEKIDTRWERPEKYSWVIHAEANAVANAARVGVSLKNSKMYMNYAPCPCTSCTQLIIQSGIVTIIGPDIPFPGVGTGSFYDTENIAKKMLIEVNIKQYIIEYEKEKTPQ